MPGAGAMRTGTSNCNLSISKSPELVSPQRRSSSKVALT
jgi:hypothetical protein